MEILFIHPGFPAQYQQLAARLAGRDDFTVTALCEADWTVDYPDLPDIRVLRYPAPRVDPQRIHPYLKRTNEGVQRGQEAARSLIELKVQGYEPDVIYVHPGWGDGLYVKDVFPNTPVIGFCEYYYRSRGADMDFDPARPLTLDDIFRTPLLNYFQIMALESFDVLISPTQWQRSRYPAFHHDRIMCLHDGIDTGAVKPDDTATFSLAHGRTFHAGEEILTYVSRGFEPYRGFHVFMNALPAILEARPDCQVLMVGGERNHYGPAPAGYDSWKQKLLTELGDRLDLSRVHFTGKLEYPDYLRVLQVSRAHVYLTYPFVLSWSMLEAMAAGCLLIASDTAPVREVLAHEVNGLLFPFFDGDALTETVVNALADPHATAPLRAAAVTTVKKRYDFERIVFPKHLELLNNLKESIRHP